MSGAWNKLKKSLSFKSSAATSEPPSPSQIPPRVPIQSDSRSPSSANSSSSLSSRFSRSISGGSRSGKKTCAICLGNVRSGQGQAIFTAECSHSFHFSCIASSVKHGNYLCPICRSEWKEIPSQLPTANLDPNPNRNNPAGRARVSPYQAPPEDHTADFSRPLRPHTPHHPDPVPYSDDEPLLDVTYTTNSPTNKISIKSFTEFPAVAAQDSVSEFAVLVGVRAPPLLDEFRQIERTPIDLVAVLDVSGSMSGSKLLLKRAVNFVIDNLGPTDRLSIVSFSSTSKRIYPLRRMTESGRQNAKNAVTALSADGGTDIFSGLKRGARVLEERREMNPVASVILLSDGRDTYNNNNGRDAYYAFPVHTFGFGSDHDSSAMHAISDASRGTFSFIESVGMVQDALARCIGGLLSVVAQELRISMTSSSPGVEIRKIPSGKYASEIFDSGLVGKIKVGDLYADEEKEFLVYVSIPACPIGSETIKTSLLKITCSYEDTTSKEIVEMEGDEIEIVRPSVLSETDAKMSLKVDRQKNRLLVAKTIKEAQELAEVGNLEGAQGVLAKSRSTLLGSASAQAGDSVSGLLEAELIEIRERMASMEMYHHTGRAYVLSGLSSHSWQRATTRGDSTTQTTTIVRDLGSSSHSAPIGYDTPSMVNMLSKSQNLGVVCPGQQVSRQNKSANLRK